jgi:succinate dehydrogenase hydrophobic anchor subunit
MKSLLRVFPLVHGLIAVLFALASLALIAVATRIGVEALFGGLNKNTAQEIIEAVGLLAAAVVALQIAQTVAEEEIIRATDISGPTRVRRFLSRFFVVVVVALAVEGLVATFKAVREEMEQLVYASSLLLSSGALLAAWGVFIRCNRAAEELEPEAMHRAKQEDRKLE